ncbi:MAG: ROK family protein, partial [Actinobacteria bacterium]|nr:ROK family protein [Actinomycetota bacterium]
LMPGADSRPVVDVVLAQMGADAGALGAALLASDPA